MRALSAQAKCRLKVRVKITQKIFMPTFIGDNLGQINT